MSSVYNNMLLKIATSTKAEWEATTFPIPDGMLCYETDTGDSKVGNGDDLYLDLYTAFDAIPVALRELIDSGKLVYAVDGLIPTSYFPSDVFNIHVAVPNIAARNALDIEIIRNSQMVVVVDATGDPTVKLGMAFYVAKFSDETTYEWIKVGEQESIDLDLSQYLKTADTTLDQIDDSAVYRRLTPDELTTLHDAMQPTDEYMTNPDDYLYWFSPYDDYLKFRLTGYNPAGKIDESGNNITISGNATISSTLLRNEKTTLRIGSNSFINIPSAGIITADPWTISFYMALNAYTSSTGVTNGVFTYSTSAGGTTTTNNIGIEIPKAAPSGYLQLVKGTGTGLIRHALSVTSEDLGLLTWHRFKLTHENGIFKVYVDHMVVGEFTIAVNFTSTRAVFGYIGLTSNNFGSVNGYMQEIDIYNGVAIPD